MTNEITDADGAQTKCVHAAREFNRTSAISPPIWQTTTFLAESSEKTGLGCSDALNLDGGPSTQLVVRLPALTLSLRGGWGVPNALVATPGKR